MDADMQQSLQKLYDSFVLYGAQVLAAIFIFIVGYVAAKILKAILRRALNAKNVDPTIVVFVSNLAFAAMLVFVIVAALSKLGVETTSLIAIIGAAGLAIGFALQGSLSNFASGLLIIMFRPLKVNEYVNVAGAEGVVNAIELFTTTLTTLDNKTIVIPNSSITSSNIVNFSRQDKRRVDHVVGVSYSDDIDKVRSILMSIAQENPKVLKDPPCEVYVKEYADSSVNFVFRMWVKTEDYWNVYFATLERVKKEFDKHGVKIPFPQQDVYLHTVKGD
ncbi:MAG: mechanosensitive ion channel [Planctomycetota bacterium]